jgi:UPF0755 protein
VTPRDQDSLTDHDPHSLLFGHEDEDDTGHLVEDFGPPTRAGRHSRDSRAPHVRRRRNRRVMWLLSLLGLIVVAVSAWLIVPKVVDLVHTPDYSGTGSGSVSVTIAQGDTASDIASVLRTADVVKSQKSFIDAAGNNSQSEGIQPGTYTLHKHMSANNALNLLLDPASRSAAGDVLVTEGATVFDVQTRLLKVLGTGEKTAIASAIGNVSALGIPLGYAPNAGKVTSAEGFLYPATYPLDPKGSAESALRQMITKFAEHDRTTNFAADAKKLGVTPYDALIIASIGQSEALFPDDMAKVARVILNRIAANRPLQIDATSAYAAKVKGLDPTKIVFSQIDSPYNSYKHDGLPPTPISNPGAEALNAAVHPPAGDWMFYVNKDAAGHLFFTNDEAAFTQAVAKCKAEHWGCG